MAQFGPKPNVIAFTSCYIPTKLKLLIYDLVQYSERHSPKKIPADTANIKNISQQRTARRKRSNYS